MVTYDEVLFLGIEYGLLAIVPIVLAVLGWLFWRHHWRRGVFADVQLNSGPDFRKQYLPKKGMIVTKKFGAYVATREGQSGTFKGKPMYRYAEGYPYPIIYKHDRIPIEISKDGKTVTEYQEIVKPLPLAPSAYRLSAYEKDRTHAQVYGGGGRLEIMLLIIAALAVFILIAVIAK